VCELGALNSGQGAIITINVEPIEAGVLNNKAEASYEGADPQSVTTKASQSTTVIRVADLSVERAENSSTPVPGLRHDYIYTVTNNGPSDSSGVALIDALPAGVSFISSGSDPIDCSETGGIVRCDLDILLRGDSITVTIPVIVEPWVIGSLTNTVFIVANEADLDLNNNTFREVSPINRLVDLALSKTYSEELSTEVNTAAYVFAVINNGPSDASGVKIIDVLPEGMTYVSFTGGARSCAVEDDTVTCQVGNLSAGENMSISMFFSHTANGMVTNTARVSSEEEDAVPDSDSASATIELQSVTIEPETPETINVPEPAATPEPTAVPPEEGTPAIPEGAFKRFGWVLLVVVIGGGLILLGGLRVVLGRRGGGGRRGR
jgi:uncharacterized repeat protein (TIGR01451 family)